GTPGMQARMQENLQSQVLRQKYLQDRNDKDAGYAGESESDTSLCVALFVGKESQYSKEERQHQR
ncbi:MAG: hypothetical protein ACI391_02750, partial [Muribaculaceae bacterium]